MKKITQLLLFFVSCLVFAQPTNNAAVPTKDAANVVSIYSDTYTDITTNFDPFWGQAGAGLVNSSYDPGTGNLVLAYPNFNYQGTEVTATNAAGMEYLHIDIWVASGTNRMVKVSPINNGTGVVEFLVEVPVTPGAWNSVDIPKSSFTGMTWDSVFQFKVDGQFNGDGSANTTTPFDVYFDNIYFWKEPVASGTDATLSDLKIDGVSISNFSGASTEYNYGVPEGTTSVPQITMTTTTDSNATVTTTTQATTIPGTATVLVTAQDGTTTETYTVTINITTPTTNPTAPPSRNASDVLAVYGEAYGTITGIDYNPNWGQSGIASVNASYDPGSGDLLLAYPNFNYQGTDFSGNAQDVSNMEYLHVDIWVPTGTSRMVKITPINTGTGTGEFLVEVPIVAGAWNSVDLEKSAFTGMTWDNVIQMKFDGQFNADGSANTTPFDIYIDNVYFWKGMSLSNNSIEATSHKVSPNPTTSTWNLSYDTTIQSIEVVNLMGEIVYKNSPNSKEASIDGSGLVSGMYLAKVKTNNTIRSIKLLKH